MTFDEQHAIEKAADAAARSRADHVSWRKAAETWAFRGLDDPDPVLVPATTATTGWACPNEHAAVVTLTSRAGRVYGMCATCHEFEGRHPAATPAPTPAVTPEPTPAVTPEPTPAVTPETIYALSPPCGGFPVVALASRFVVTEAGLWRDTRACSTCGQVHEYTPPAPARIICVLRGYEPPDSAEREATS